MKTFDDGSCVFMRKRVSTLDRQLWVHEPTNVTSRVDLPDIVVENCSHTIITFKDDVYKGRKCHQLFINDIAVDLYCCASDDKHLYGHRWIIVPYIHPDNTGSLLVEIVSIDQWSSDDDRIKFYYYELKNRIVREKRAELPSGDGDIIMMGFKDVTVWDVYISEDK